MCSKTSKEKLCSTDCSDWASFPGSLVDLFLDKLLEPIDHVHFATVCKELHAVSKDYNETKQRWCKRRLPPMLLISSTESKEKLELYSISEKKVYCSIELPLPCRNSRRCFGSNHDSGDWLTILDLVEEGDDSPYLHITLIDPFTKEVAPILLPPLQCRNYFGRWQPPKVLLSGDPTLNPDSFMVLAINRQSTGLFSIKGLNSDWVNWNYAPESNDALVYKSQIYSVTPNLMFLTMLDVDQAITSHFFSELPLRRPGYGKLYLVESTKGGLLLVIRVYGTEEECVGGLHKKFWTSSFIIHKVVFSEREEKLDRGIPAFDEGSAHYIGDLYVGDGDRSQYFQHVEVIKYWRGSFVCR